MAEIGAKSRLFHLSDTAERKHAHVVGLAMTSLLVHVCMNRLSLVQQEKRPGGCNRLIPIFYCQLFSNQLLDHGMLDLHNFCIYIYIPFIIIEI